MELPEEAEVVNLCGSHLTSVEADDLRFFERLSAVNAADNYLKMVSVNGPTGDCVLASVMVGGIWVAKAARSTWIYVVALKGSP